MSTCQVVKFIKDTEAKGCITVDCVTCVYHFRNSAHSCVYFVKSHDEESICMHECPKPLLSLRNNFHFTTGGIKINLQFNVAEIILN